jgi:hypothetical protein
MDSIKFISTAIIGGFIGSMLAHALKYYTIDNPEIKPPIEPPLNN